MGKSPLPKKKGKKTQTPRPSLSEEAAFQFLCKVEPFRNLAHAAIRDILKWAKINSYEKGNAIYNEGEDAKSVWVLCQGRVQILKYTTSGKPYAIESLGPGELMGTLCRMGGNGRTYPCTATAANATTVLEIPDKVFLDYYMKSVSLVRGVCSLCATRLKDAQDLRCTSQEPVLQRISSLLVRLHEVHGAMLPFTKREISELVGTTLETTFRTLSHLQKQGHITSLRSQIRIENLEKIRTISENV